MTQRNKSLDYHYAVRYPNPIDGSQSGLTTSKKEEFRDDNDHAG
jgi:hypothetical protein